MSISRHPSHVSLTDAKQRLGELVKRAAYGGERIVLEFRGRPVAAIVPYEAESTDNSNRQEMISELRSLRERGMTYRTRSFESAAEFKRWRAALSPEQLEAEKSEERRRALEALQHLDEIRERIAARSGRLPDSADLIRQMREERDEQLSGLS